MSYIRTRVRKDSFHVEGNKEVISAVAPAAVLHWVRCKWTTSML